MNTRYRNRLPQLAGDIFLTDGGLETTLIFHQGWDLPDFAAFTLLESESGYRSLQQYFRTYLDLAKTYRVGLVLESATWRANSDRGTRLGYSSEGLAKVNRKAIDLLRQPREEHETVASPMVISGCIGPRGDGYDPAEKMSVEAAKAYHSAQIRTFSETAADLVTAMTINYIEEAIGIALAARAIDMPVVISFTVETDGNLPTGQTLEEAIETVDKMTDNAPVYYAIDRAHPTHIAALFTTDQPYLQRIRGLRANSSSKSHAELNGSIELDEGNPTEFGEQYRQIRALQKQVTVLGGCCGTDLRHVEAVCKSCLPLAWTHLNRPISAGISR